jgi:hypothetical protein
MKIRVYKSTIAALGVCLLAGTMCFAQVQPPQPVQAPSPVAMQITSGDGAIVSLSAQADAKTIWSQVREFKSDLKDIAATVNTQVIAALQDAGVKAEVAGIIPHVSVKPIYSSGSNNNQDNTVFKNYSKVYPADADDKLVIDNCYGKVTVNTWDKNSFKVDVQVKASARSSDQAKDILDDVNISDAKNGSDVAFRTDIDQAKSIWKTIFGGGDWSQHSLEVNYTIYMPAKNELVIRNRYGAVSLPDLYGKVTVDCSYGSLRAGSLTNESAIRVKYGNADIGNLGATSIDLSYGNLSLGAAGKIEANVSYSGVNIGKLRETGAFNMRYGGGLKIEDLDKAVSRLAINSTYSSVNIGLSGDENASFDVTVHYGDFNYHDHTVTITDKSPGDNDRGPHLTKSYKGYLGKGSADKSISINANYGSVQFD